MLQPEYVLFVQQKITGRSFGQHLPMFFINIFLQGSLTLSLCLPWFNNAIKRKSMKNKHLFWRAKATDGETRWQVHYTAAKLYKHAGATAKRYLYYTNLPNMLIHNVKKLL